VHVRESIVLEQPVAEVYRFWRRLENLPRIMSHLEKVTETNDGHSHWVARGPGGMQFEWDARIINDVENEIIAWQSLPGSDVVSAGSVRFDPSGNGRSTQVSVHLQYAPPAGRLGTLAASLIGGEPSHIIREDLTRLKTRVEAVETPRL